MDKTTPFWLFKQNLIIIKKIFFKTYSKNNTNPIIYQQIFEHIKEQNADHKFIYTDGSATNNTITFAITENEVLRHGFSQNFHQYCRPKLSLLYQATVLASKSNRKNIICSDSLSALEAIANCNNSDYQPTIIRSYPSQHKKNKK